MTIRPRGHHGRTVIWSVVAILVAGMAIISFWQLTSLHIDRSPAVLCQENLSFLAWELLAYAEDNGGKLPPAGYEPGSARPRWVEALCSYASSSRKRVVMRHLKCPNDHTAAATSYILNPRVAGRSVLKIPEGDKPKIPLLWEARRSHPGMRLLAYLDAHMETVRCMK